jgi:hypothetical protein
VLDEARFRAAVLKLFPLGIRWSEAEKRVRALVFPYSSTPDHRRDSVNLYNAERRIHCETSVSYMGCSFFTAPEIAAVSLDDRTWHFQMRFGVSRALQDLHAGSTSVPCWNNHNPSAACLKKAIDDCRSKDGIWYGHVKGRGRDTGCNLPTR